MTDDVKFWTRVRDEAQLKINEAQWEAIRNRPANITPIKVGDTVWCALFDEEDKNACPCQGRVVLEISLDGKWVGYIPIGSNTVLWHNVFYLRHIAERSRTKEEVQ